MANILTVIRDTIATYLLGGTNSFKTAVSSHLYINQIPDKDPATQENIAPPFCVLSVQPISRELDSVHKFASFELQFSIASETDDEGELIYEYLNDMLEDHENDITFNGYSTIEIRLISVVSLGLEGNLRNYTCNYSFLLQKN